MQTMRIGLLTAAMMVLAATGGPSAAADVTYATQYKCTDKAVAALDDAKELKDRKLFTSRLDAALATGDCSVVVAEEAAVVTPPEPKPTAAAKNGVVHKKTRSIRRQRTAQRDDRKDYFPPSWLFRPRR